MALDPLTLKETFLQGNKLFSELELTDESTPIGKLHKFDVMDNEIWLLQCPKDMNIHELQNEKLNLPGRTTINNSEAVCMEFNEGNQQHAFAYCSRKKRYDLRLLPVRGTIIFRDRLKAAETVTEVNAENCSPVKRVPMPESIRLRHPLLGVQYENKLHLDKSVMERLQKADQVSAQILKESLIEKTKLPAGVKRARGKQEYPVCPIDINSSDDVEFISEAKIKRKKNRNKSEVSNSFDYDNVNKDFGVNEVQFVSEDLQWLKNI